jgi:hypothetical protein
MFSFFGLAGGVWAGGIGTAGVAARHTTPLVKDGFIPTLNDSFELEVGVNAWRWFTEVRGSGFSLANEARWTFHFTPQFAAYAMAGLGPAWGYRDDGKNYFAVFITAGMGIHFHISESVAVRAEVDPTTAMLGLGFGL